MTTTDEKESELAKAAYMYTDNFTSEDTIAANIIFKAGALWLLEEARNMSIGDSLPLLGLDVTQVEYIKDKLIKLSALEKLCGQEK